MVLLALLGQTAQVLVVALISDLDQAFVKPALIRAAFVAPNQQNGLSLGIKRECHPPDATLPILLWSSFLKNGGQIVIGLAAGLLCWALARCWATVRPPTPTDR